MRQLNRIEVIESSQMFRRVEFAGGEGRVMPHVAKVRDVRDDRFDPRDECAGREHDPPALAGAHGADALRVDIVPRKEIIDAAQHVHIRALVEVAFRLLDAAQKVAQSLAPDLAKADGQAIDVMKKYGLKINQVPPETVTVWVDLLQKTFSGLVGRAYDKTSFEMATGYLAEYLTTHPRK